MENVLNVKLKKVKNKKMKKERKFIYIMMAVFVLGILFVALIGIYNKGNLKEEVGSINNLDDVRKFMEKCRNKVFLDCESLLERELEKTSSGDKK